MAPGFRELGRIGGVVQVLVVDLVQVAHRLPMPDIAHLPGPRRVLVPIGLDIRILARMAGGEAPGRIEVGDTVGNRPDKGQLVLVIDIVIAAFILRVHQLLPRAICLEFPGHAGETLRRVGPGNQEIDLVAGIDRLDRHLGVALIGPTAHRNGHGFSLPPGSIIAGPIQRRRLVSRHRHQRAFRHIAGRHIGLVGDHRYRRLRGSWGGLGAAGLAGGIGRFSRGGRTTRRRGSTTRGRRAARSGRCASRGRRAPRAGQVGTSLRALHARCTAHRLGSGRGGHGGFRPAACNRPGGAGNCARRAAHRRRIHHSGSTDGIRSHRLLRDRNGRPGRTDPFRNRRSRTGTAEIILITTTTTGSQHKRQGNQHIDDTP